MKELKKKKKEKNVKSELGAESTEKWRIEGRGGRGICRECAGHVKRKLYFCKGKTNEYNQVYFQFGT